MKLLPFGGTADIFVLMLTVLVCYNVRSPRLSSCQTINPRQVLLTYNSFSFNTIPEYKISLQCHQRDEDFSTPPGNDPPGQYS